MLSKGHVTLRGSLILSGSERFEARLEFKPDKQHSGGGEGGQEGVRISVYEYVHACMCGDDGDGELTASVGQLGCVRVPFTASSAASPQRA